jgi:cystathionine beta-lyase
MYDFSHIANRRNTFSLKWDVKDNELPMWVADMDFETPDFILESLKETISIKNFGYKNIPAHYFKSFKDFWARRHNFIMDEKDMIFSTGVVPAISSIVRKVTSVGEKVLVTTPCYNIFFNSIVNNGRFIETSELVLKDNEYYIDFLDLEKKLSDPQVSLFILCNPENPVGRIWTEEELVKIGELCKKYNVIVLSDEIHCDIVNPKFKYIPFASVNETNKEISITCMSASKCFSLAGLQGALVYVSNPKLHHLVWRGLNTDEVAEANAFVANAFISALDNGDLYLEELNKYIQNNKDYAREFIKNNIKEFNVRESNATYLLWVDVSGLTSDARLFTDFLRRHTGLFITPGEEYGKNGVSYVRINLGTSLDIVKDGMSRLKNGVDLFKEKQCK